MAKGKSSRRAAARRRAARPVEPIVRPAVTPTSRPEGPSRPTMPAAASKKADLVAEYRYVVSDLKRLGILAAAMFALLVVLALIVR